MRWLSWRFEKRENPAGRRPRWLLPAFVAFTVVGALMAVGGEGTDRIWGVIAVTFFGVGGLAVCLPKGERGPGVFVERAEHRGGRWGLSFPFDRRRQLAQTLALLSMAISGFLMAWFADDLGADDVSRRGSPAALRVAGIVCVVTFGGVAAILLVRGRPASRMLLLEEGLELEMPGGRTFVPWDAITEVGVVSMNGAEMIALDVDDPQRIDIGPIGRRFLRLNRQVAGSDVSYPLDAFVADARVVVDAVRRFAHDPEERRRLGAGDVDVSEIVHAGAGAGVRRDG